MSSFETILLEVDEADRVATVTLNRPERLNTLTPTFFPALRETVESLNAEGRTRAMVISSTGKHFSAGMALDVFAGGMPMLDTTTARRRLAFQDSLRQLMRCFDVLEEARFPVIAAVQGGCIGGALDLVCACDIRVCSENATFGLAETKWGDPIDAVEAHRVGLVNRVVPLPELLDTALGVARRIADRGPLAVREARARVLDGLGLEHDEAMAREHAAFLRVMRTDDAVEGPAAFAEKRPAAFNHR